MNVARLLYPVEVLGPGRRLGIWLCGCGHQCPACCNPELWTPRPEYEISVTNLLCLINKVANQHTIDGFTVSGGEPFDQAGELAKLLPQLAAISDDILLYSGYTLPELQNRRDAATDRVLSDTVALIDGRYIDDLNDGEKLRGSRNQTVHILKPAFKPLYDDYLQAMPNAVQNFAGRDGLFAAGIHNRGAYAALRQHLPGAKPPDPI